MWHIILVVAIIWQSISHYSWGERVRNDIAKIMNERIRHNELLMDYFRELHDEIEPVYNTNLGTATKEEVFDGMENIIGVTQQLFADMEELMPDDYKLENWPSDLKSFWKERGVDLTTAEYSNDEFDSLKFDFDNLACLLLKWFNKKK